MGNTEQREEVFLGAGVLHRRRGVAEPTEGLLDGHQQELQDRLGDGERPQRCRMMKAMIDRISLWRSSRRCSRSGAELSSRSSASLMSRYPVAFGVLGGGARRGVWGGGGGGGWAPLSAGGSPWASFCVFLGVFLGVSAAGFSSASSPLPGFFRFVPASHFS